MTNETMNNEMRNKDKVDFFMQEKVKVHVTLQDRSFLNGFVDKELKENVYWFIDDKLNGVYLFLKDVYDIETFTGVSR